MRTETCQEQARPNNVAASVGSFKGVLGICGASHSGTSCVASICQRVGFDFGHGDNITKDTGRLDCGYGENMQFWMMNMRIVNDCGGDTEIDQVKIRKWMAPAGGNGHLLLKQFVPTLKVSAIKDPRLALTIDAWRFHVTHWIFTIRNPWASIKSISTYQQQSVGYAAKWWARYYERILDNTDSINHAFVDYDNFTTDIVGEVHRAFVRIGFDVPIVLVKDACKKAYDPKRNHRATDKNRIRIPGYAEDLYEKVMRVRNG